MGRILKNKRTIIKVLLDVFIIIFAGILTSLVLYDNVNSENKIIVFMYLVICFFISSIENGIAVSWSYTDTRDVLTLVFINIISAFITGVLLLCGNNLIFKFVFLLFVFSTSMQLLARFFFRVQKKERYSNKTKKNTNKRKALIYGAGEAGLALLHESRLNQNFPYKICGFLDDDPKKISVSINGVRVFGSRKEAIDIISELKIKTFILAIPSMNAEKINSIYNRIKNVEGLEIKILPYVSDILNGESLTDQVRNIDIYDLLGREEQTFDDSGLHNFLGGKTIIITGGGGSIGSELSRQIAKYNPKKLINIDINENSLYLLELEIQRHYPNIDLTSEICSIRDKKKLREVFKKYMPDIVFHAAAHKHVPLMEHNPEEAVKNNVFGTKNLVDVVDECGVDKFVMISTDKAVNPTNVMGATKRACELIVENKNKESKTKFMAVRFGNVLGSNGSVIPIFKSLIAEGKNLRVTHRDITRYFMTIPEASRLVIEAGRLGTGGELFILDMGKSVKIMDLARNMIKLSNAKVGIEIVGLRPGEKLYEELLYDTKAAIKTENNKIFITKMTDDSIDIDYYLDKFRDVIKLESKDKVKEVMHEMITTYREVEYN
ncbi:nucleoside-diphosphate sugar epimerase/dehydratase [Fusobacterium sp. IOR10]|uniref:polysaccharide biosynthesis protein n=1 Tax=Fusobacterium sp. IOR10 TaxID=2665157 RepID=UPI0013D35697|nr:nucleoside-diphosphate sugar epimerase/dehydratase [Fusobacterium sp. IOR10]